MCRLRANFARLGDPLQGLHKGKQANRAGARWKCTPIPACGGTSPRESVSRDFQVATLPYKSRSLATPVGEVCSTLHLVLT